MSAPIGKARITIEAVASDKSRNGETTEEAEHCTEDTRTDCVIVSKEQLLRLEIQLCNVDESQTRRDQTHLVLVVDNSGSMAGQPWKQVKESLHAIVGSSIKQTNLKTDLIIYNTKAQAIPFTKSNYAETIDGLSPCGMTNFVSAFKKVYDSVSIVGPEFNRTVVVFLTDGQDTVNNGKDIQQLIPKLREGFTRHNKQATVHTVGFSKDHDFRFLKCVAEDGGTCPGMFRYCEPCDDRQALQRKLDELFDFILQSDDKKVKIEMVDGKNFILGQSNLTNSATISAKAMAPTEETRGQEGTLFTVEAWLSLDDPNDIPTMSISVETELKIDNAMKSVSIPCEIVQVERRMLESAAEKTEWRLRILERNVDDLMNKTASAIAEKTDISHLQSRVEKCQKRIAHTRVFGNGISKPDRERMFELIKDVQTSLDQIQKMLAEYMRSGTDSISLLARAHDMRYQAVFNKNRRQRVMDKRASKNMQFAASAQHNLTNLVVDKDEINRLSQESQDFYFCVMSQNTVQDVLLGNEVEDAIGFGLAVKRSEVVLDEPTLIRIHVISGTLVSRNAMFDALEYKINVSSHLKAHGGFDFDKNSLGVTTVGTSREPINSWLPLYITKSHWERVKVILKPALGSFCTLDPLGYHYKQMDVLFMVLGSMIGQLSDETIGEHQLRMMFAVLRTCSACLLDFDKVVEASDIVKNFVASPVGRTKDIIPNLHTLIGYVVSLPSESRSKIFHSEDTIRQFWLAYISEWLRRAAGTVYKETTIVDLNGILNGLLNGIGQGQVKAEKPVCNFTKELERLCLHADTIQVEMKPFDPASEVQAPDVELKHSEHVDRAMEIWAEKTTGHQKNIDKTKKYKVALRQVNAWLNAGDILKQNLPTNTNDSRPDAEVGGAIADVDSDTESAAHTEEQDMAHKSDKGGEFDMENITDSVLEIIAQIQNRLVNAAYPNIHSMPGLLAFCNTWLLKEHDLADMDANSGIAPDVWINEIKKAVLDTYNEMNGKAKSGESSEAVQSVVETENVTESITVVVNQENVEEITDKEKVTKDTDENNGDEDYENNYDDGGDDDDDSIAYSAAGNIRRKSNNKGQDKQICLPQILRFIDGRADVVQVLRAMLCQAVRFNTNSSARMAAANNQLLDMAGGTEATKVILTLNYVFLEEHKVNAIKNVIDKAMWKRANYCMIHATTPWAFVGYLMNTHTSRLEGFSDLIDLVMTSVTEDKDPPYLKEKVHILLTGQYHKCPVLDNGNQWLPEKKMAKHFMTLLGPEVWCEFEMELRASVKVHVYRESDIPNRHGHCNSNPYIPNILRLKLGMALMPEKNSIRGNRNRKK